MYVTDGAKKKAQKVGYVCVRLGKLLSHNLDSKEVPEDLLPQRAPKAPWVFRIRNKSKKIILVLVFHFAVPKVFLLILIYKALIRITLG